MARKKTEYNRIKDELTSQGKTQVWLADQLDVDFKTVSRYCSNLNQPSVATLFEIAKVLKISPKQLING